MNTLLDALARLIVDVIYLLEGKSSPGAGALTGGLCLTGIALIGLAQVGLWRHRTHVRAAEVAQAEVLLDLIENRRSSSGPVWFVAGVIMAGLIVVAFFIAL